MTRAFRLMIAALALSACGGGASLVTEPASRRVARAVDRGASSASAVDGFSALLRYNPAPCDCPDWELKAGSRWVRCAIELPEASAPGWSSGPTALVEVRAYVRMTRASVLGVDGWRYPVVEWVSDEAF